MLDMCRNYDPNYVDLLSKLGSSIRDRRYDLQKLVNLVLFVYRYCINIPQCVAVMLVKCSRQIMQFNSPILLTLLLSSRCLVTNASRSLESMSLSGPSSSISSSSESSISIRADAEFRRRLVADGGDPGSEGWARLREFVADAVGAGIAIVSSSFTCC